MDDEELDRYILSEKEAQHKSALWNKINAEYLVQQKEKEAKRLKEKEEGKPEKKRRRTTSRKNKTPANTAGRFRLRLLLVTYRFSQLFTSCSYIAYRVLFSVFFSPRF